VQSDETASAFDLHLSFRIHSGSCEHYFHFLLGFLVPLVHFMANSEGRACSPRNIYVRSCAVFDEILRSLGYSNLIILPKTRHAAFQNCIALPDQAVLRRATIDGFDGEFTPCAGSVFNAVASCLQNRLAKTISSERCAILRNVKNRVAPVVVLIDRDVPHPFYSSPESEKKTAGRQRRSISNFASICEKLRAQYDNVIVTTLEGKSLAYQIALFHTADIVIAQHGAALANLIWARAGTTVLDIVPQDLHPPAAVHIFPDLAGVLHQTCRQIKQTGIHGAADIDELMGAIGDIVQVGCSSSATMASRHP
jgi:hypothetical protein